jgi:hypothetical protein
VFPHGERFFLAADHIRCANDSDGLIFRLDMPGHIRRDAGGGFDHVHLSYHDPAILPSTEFGVDFPPDGRFLYRRDPARVPGRFIRGYQVQAGPWLAGMTLEPADVHEAWCHARGYVCMIEEIGGRPVAAGDVLGACHLIGWFDDLAAMERAFDAHRGWSGLALEGPPGRPTGFRGLRRDELT